MTVRSSIPAVITQLLASITTAIAGQVDDLGSPVVLQDGELPTYPGQQFIQIVGVSGTQTSGSIGNLRRVEDYDVNGMVRVFTGSDNQAYTRQRAFDLFALIEAILTSDPTLGGTVQQGYAEINRTDLRMGVDSEGRSSELDFSITVHNEIHQ